MTMARACVGVFGTLVLGLSISAGAAPAAQAPPRERRLHLASAESSSYLVNDWNKFQENYLPLYVGDDDPKTAWTLKTEGIGEWLRVHVTSLPGATKVRLKVRNGYQKTAKLWAANSRAHGLTVTLLPSKKTVDVDLTDTSGWQEVAVEQAQGPLEAIELRVRSVYAGKKYDDLCLSDVQVFVTATTPDNPAFEKARLQKIVDWKKGRLDAAKLFATQLGQTMPVAPQYVASTNEGTNEGATKGDDDGRGGGSGVDLHCRDALCYVRQQVEQALVETKGAATRGLKAAHDLSAAQYAGMTAARISTRDKRPLPQIDGTCLPTLDTCNEDPCLDRFPLPAQLGYLDTKTLVTTEQKDLPSAADVIALKPPQCKRAEPTTFAFVSRDPAAADGTPGAVCAALLVTCGLVEGREGMYPVARPELLVYGADGLLEVVASASSAAVLAWTTGDAGPKLVSARVNAGDGKPVVFTAATSLAAK